MRKLQVGLSLLFLFFCVSGVYAQVSQDLVEKARAAGMSDAQIQEELTKRMNGSHGLKEGLNGREFDSDVYKRRSGYYEDPEMYTVEMQREDNMPDDNRLVVFGREIFTNKNLTFNPDLNVPTPKNYALAAGDEVYINVWGDSELNLLLTISPEGTILIPNLGPIHLSGLTIEAAEKKIKRELGRIMSNIISGDSPNTFVSLSLGKIRSLQVHIVGEAISPGTYTLPSFATLFNALYAAGGVNDIGSLRNIKVYRESKEIACLDVYDYLLHGKYDANIRLENNDMIIIGPYEQLVSVTGKVKRNRIFEVKHGETLDKVLHMAGGFSGDAYTEDVRVKRKTGKRYSISTVRSNRFSEFHMHDGDSLIVDSVMPFYENRLHITGAVWRPGEYELCDEVCTVKDLVALANGLKGDEFTGRAHIVRLNDDFTTSVIALDIRAILSGREPDIRLLPEDRLHIPSLEDMREPYTIKVSGAVNFPDTILPYSYSMTVEDAIVMAGGLAESAAIVNVEVARRIKNPTSVSSNNRIAEEFNFTLSDNFEMSSNEPAFFLEPFDEVYVRFSPGYSNQQVVKINGEVTFAGNYVLSVKNSRLSHLINKAGGITPDAYVRGASLKRQLTEDEMRRLETLLDLSSNKGGRDSIDISVINMTNYSVGIDLERALKYPGSTDDLVLRDGDELYIPQYQSTVKISGSVSYPNSVTYTNRMSVKDCLSQAGGYDDTARKYPMVVYMNGKVATTQRRVFFKKYPKIEPGCEIIVPAKSKNSGKMSTAEVLSLSSSTTSIAAMITSIINNMK